MAPVDTGVRYLTECWTTVENLSDALVISVFWGFEENKIKYTESQKRWKTSGISSWS